MSENTSIDFGNDDILRILLKLAPPVMIAQLIQALYNIIDSFFIGRYSEEGLTALSIIYPLQLLMIALAVGTGVGINTLMAHYEGVGRTEKSHETAGSGTVIALVMWFVFSVFCYFIMPAYAKVATNSQSIIHEVIVYGRIVGVFSIGLFLESVWTKVLQAGGNMKVPMVAQIVGAVINIILDPILIFGTGFIPKLGIAGAAIATVTGQIAAAIIVIYYGFKKYPKYYLHTTYVKSIYRLGFPNILMQSAYTFYILGLNIILKGFSDQAVTALGLYYKWQTFFFIPLGAMQTCIVPVISYNFSSGRSDRCKKTLIDSVAMGMVLMFIGTLCFEIFPGQLLCFFSSDREVISIGTHALRVIGLSFVPMVTSLIFPVFFQAIGYSVQSSILTVIRTVALFVPLGWLLSHFGLAWFWFTFPITEIITTTIGFIFYRQFKLKNNILKQTG